LGHATPEELADLAPLLERVRKWEHVRETAPNVFYVKRTPFLHFHADKAGRRFADVRCGAAWGPRLSIPFEATKKERAAFAREVERRHGATVDSLA
jgi:hypothetical protein